MFNTYKIKKIRIENAKTQDDVAKILGVGRSSYAMWESNNNIIPIKRLLMFCDFFNVSLDYIFDLNNENYSKINSYNKELSSHRIKSWRKENNITQEKISQFLHIDQPTWSIYENAKSIIGTPFLYMICKKYNISADYLLGKVDEPKYLK